MYLSGRKYKQRYEYKYEDQFVTSKSRVVYDTGT